MLNKDALSKLYDELYDKADALLKKYKPCEFKDGVCGVIPGHDTCCYDCRHLTDKGCTVKALFCKVWLCGYKEFDKELEDGLQDIADEAREHRLLTVRAGKEVSMANALMFSGHSDSDEE